MTRRHLPSTTRIRAHRLRFGLLPTAVIAALIPIAALANAAVPNSTTGTKTVNADGTVTLTVSGQWTWPALSGDCNLKHRAVGYAVDWNDATQPGNVVATVNGTTLDVGAAAGNTRNPQDNAVHPTPVTEFPGAWGGCGRPNASAVSAGVWGPISHTYAAGSGPSFTVCVVMYDVGLSSNGGQPTNSKQTVAGGSNHNGDNSAQQTGAVTGCQTITPATAAGPSVPPTGVAASGAAAPGVPTGLLVVGAGIAAALVAAGFAARRPRSRRTPQ